MKFLLLIFVLGYLFATVSGTSCEEGQFDCKDGFCLPPDWVCDGAKDCRDGSDEVDCPPPPPCDEFVCDGGYRCIPRESECDGRYDCADGSDEPEGCECKGFICKDGSCIPKDYECDRYNDCADGDDEHENCEYPPCDGFECEDGICIPSHWVCDNAYDCQYGEDERNCTCDEGEVPCRDGIGCIPKDYICDGLPDCMDRSDEEDCPLVKRNAVEKARLTKYHRKYHDKKLTPVKSKNMRTNKNRQIHPKVSSKWWKFQ